MKIGKYEISKDDIIGVGIVLLIVIGCVWYILG